MAETVNHAIFSRFYSRFSIENYRTVWLRGFCNQGTSWVTSGPAESCQSVHSLWLYSAAPQGCEATGTMTQCSNQSQYPDTEKISPCSVLLMPSTRLGSDKNGLYKSLLLLNRISNCRQTWQNGQMVIAFAFRFRRSGHFDLTGSNPGQVKLITFKLIHVAFLPGAQHYYHRITMVGSVSGKRDWVGYQMMVLLAWFPGGAVL